jgi:hypothetical protein
MNNTEINELEDAKTLKAVMFLMIEMKNIKFYPSDRSLIRLNGKLYRGYTLNDVPYERKAWFNYKGLTFVTD